MTRLLRRIAFWLRFRRNQAALAEEIELHRSMTREWLERAGLNGGEAARASSRALGNVTLAREDAREIWTWRWLDGVAQDLRYGVRSLRRQPGFALTAVLTLSIGIGLNTTVATMFLSMYWRSWSVPNPADVVHIMTHDSRGVSYEFLYSRYKHLADNARLASIVATNCGTSGRSVECRTKLGGEPVLAEFVSANYFRALAIGLDRGRSFLDDEDRADAPGAVAVISHSLWERRFSSDPDILGKTIELDDEPFTVVGVAARGFNGTALLRRDVWLPLAAGRLIRPTSRDVTWWSLPHASRPASRANRRRRSCSRCMRFAIGTQQPVTILLVGTSGFPHPNDRREGFAFFAVLFLGVVLVLLLACANVGNLLLARTLARGREIAVRVSVGANRPRIVRQLLTESLLLAVAAAGLGWWMATILPTYVTDLGLRSSDTGGRLAYPLQPNAGVLAFAAVLAVLTCLAFGLAPALYVSRSPIVDTLKDERRRHVGRFPLRAVLLSVQVAVGVILLTVSGLLVRAVQQTATADFGFSVDGISVVSFEVPASYDAARVRAFSSRLIEAIDAFPHSSTFGVAMASPFADRRYRTRIRVPGDDPRREIAVGVLPVSPGYFGVLGIPIVAGRNLSAGRQRERRHPVSVKRLPHGCGRPRIRSAKPSLPARVLPPAPRFATSSAWSAATTPRDMPSASSRRGRASTNP